WFDDYFEKSINIFHGRHDFLIIDGQDIAYVLSDNRKIEVTQLGAKSVGDGFGVETRNDFSGMKRSPGIIGSLGFGAIHFGVRRQKSSSQCCAGEQTPSANRYDEMIQILVYFQKFSRTGRIALDHIHIIGRMDKNDFRMCLEILRHPGLAVCRADRKSTRLNSS